MLTEVTYITAILQAIFPKATINASYDEGDEAWYILINRPARMGRHKIIPASFYHYWMQVGSDDESYTFVEADGKAPMISFPVLHDNGTPIWESNEDADPMGEMMGRNE